MKLWFCLILMALLSSCMQAGKYMPSKTGAVYKTGAPYTENGITSVPLQSAQGYSETGIASWYGKKFHGRKTANGEHYDMYALTAAHRTLPLPTMVRVINHDNDRQIIVRVNDRGPFIKGRLIDLSYAAAKELDFLLEGTATVTVETISDVRDGLPLMPYEGYVATRKKIYVLLKSYQTLAEARQFKFLIAEKQPGSYIYFQRKDKKKKIRYRVQLGPFQNRPQLERTLMNLKNNNIKYHLIEE